MENDYSLIKMLVVIGLFFGILGGVIAYVNAYEGYSHFPEITRKKRIRMSLEIAAGGFLMAVFAGLIVYFLFNRR